MDTVNLLQLENEEQIELHKKARQFANENVGNNVYFRGLIEFSNMCKNDCLYCGIRKSNNKLIRYSLSKKEILDCAKFCFDNKYSSIVLQSGEGQDIDFVVNLIKSIKTNYDLRITLCLGEYSKQDYQKMFDAGAERYLLRIETTNKELYGQIHPNNMIFENRMKCIKDLKAVGFQVGSGVMVGIPGQTVEDLAKDLDFLKEMDMVGMGPYIPCKETPMNKEINFKKNYDFSLNMVALLRLLSPKINIAATTALQVIRPKGREAALMAGANVIMPIVTPQKYRANYQLYDDKPCVNESSKDCMCCITNRIKSVGLNPALGEFGDSLKYQERVK